MILLNKLSNKLISQVGQSKKIAFACSGGVDSMFLAVFGFSILKPLGVECVAVIVDHKLRENSTVHAIQTQKNLERYGVESVILTWTHEPIYTAIEEKARKARYGLIVSYCINYSIDKVFLAHHIDDKIETFLMNSMRGSGLDGLTSMRESVFMQGIEFLRPMIFCMAKTDIIAYMQKHQLPWVEDESNQNLVFTRNNLRRALNLTDEQKCGILTTICNLEGIKKEYDIQVEEFFKSVIVRNFTVVLPSAIYNVAKELFFRIIKKTLLCVYPLGFGEIRQQGMERVYEWLGGGHKKMTFVNCVFEKTSNFVKVYPEYHKLEIVFEEARIKKNWNNMVEATCNRACKVAPLGLVDVNVRKMFAIKESFLAIAHLPVFMEGKKILAIPHLGILSNAQFECSV